MVFLVGAIWVIQGRWQLGQLLAFQVLPGLRVWSGAFAGGSFAPVPERTDRPGARLGSVRDPARGEPGQRAAGRAAAGEVEFKDVTFAYNGVDPVLEHVSMHITPGEQVAIVGPSGVGKTTLVSLILRFYRPLQGEIFFDDRARRLITSWVRCAGASATSRKARCCWLARSWIICVTATRRLHSKR